VDGHKCLSAAHGVGPARWTGGCDGSIAIGVEVRLAHAKIVFQISNTFFSLKRYIWTNISFLIINDTPYKTTSNMNIFLFP
jgi:hypothetical protein